MSAAGVLTALCEVPRGSYGVHPGGEMAFWRWMSVVPTQWGLLREGFVREALATSAVTMGAFIVSAFRWE